MKNSRIARSRRALLLITGMLATSLTVVGATDAVAPMPAAAADILQKYDDRPALGEVNRFRYDATWGTASGIGDAHANTVHYNNGPGTATYSFIGTAGTIIAGKDSDQGIATFAVDGGDPQTVDLYGGTRQAQSVVFQTGSLPVGLHTVTIQSTGTKNASSAGTTVTVDAAEISGPELQNVDDLTASGVNAWEFDPSWGTGGSSDLYQGTVHYMEHLSTGTATFSFEGTQAVLVGVKDLDQGIASYSVDGGAAVQVDHYAARRDSQALLFDTGRLDAGEHTITVKALATKNPASTKTIIALDHAAIDGPVQPVTAPTMEVDLGQTTGDFMGGASGTLYGLYGEGLPSNNLIDGINLRTVSTKAQDGPQHPGADALEIVKPLADSSDGDVYIYMTDIYRGFPYQWPGDTPDERLDGYLEKIGDQVDQVLTLPEEYQDNIVFVPFNEPEGNMFGTGTWSYNNNSWLNNPQYFFSAWDRAHALIKAKLPDARIAGPNTSVLYNQVRGFMQHTLAQGTVPDVVTWHELGDPARIRQTVARYRSWETQDFAGTSLAGQHLPINLNEYAFNYHTSVPGQMIQWISAIEDMKVDADIAYWNIDGNLSDSAVQANRGNGQWWLLNAYSHMTGQTVKVTPPSPNISYTLQGVATLDTDRQQARAIFGGASGEANVVFDDVPGSFGSAVHALVQEIPWTGTIGDSAEPRTVAELDATVQDGSVTFGFGQDLVALDEGSAYQVILTPGASDTVPQESSIVFQKTYEAEDAAHTGGGYTRNGPEGSPGNVGGFYTSGSYNVGGLRTGSDLELDFSVAVPVDGEYDLSVFANSLNRYAAVAEQGPTNVFMTVDGGAEQELFLPLGYKWVVWDHTDTVVDLTAGEHTITLSARSSDGSRGTLGDAIVDKIDLSLANPAATADVYEAEFADLQGADADYTVNASSGAGVARLGLDDSATFWVYSPEDAESRLTLDTFGGGAGRFSVNGLGTGSVDSTTTARVFLSGGVNKIVVTGTSGTLSLDRLRVQGGDGTLTSTVYEAEAAETSGSAAVADYSLASGGKAVTDIGGAPGNSNGLTFTVQADEQGAHALTIRYSNEEQIAATHYNPDTLARHADLSVNDRDPIRVTFPPTFHKNNFWELTVPVNLDKGANTISVHSEELPNFDGVTYASDTYPDVTLRSRFAPNVDKVTVTPFVASADTPTETKDVTAPAVSLRTQPATPDGSGGWHVTPAAVLLSATDDTGVDKLEYSLDGGVTWQPYTGAIASPEGTTTVQGRATDEAGNVGQATPVVVKLDLVAPTVQISGAPPRVVWFDELPPAPQCVAQDATSGVESCLLTGYSTSRGTHTITATAVDFAGHRVETKATYTVRGFTVKGFGAPIDKGVLNTTRAGATVPLKFAVFRGTQKETASSVVRGLTWSKVPPSKLRSDRVEVLTRGETKLRFVKGSEQFVYAWRTPRKSGDYRVSVALRDGSTLKALFRLR